MKIDLLLRLCRKMNIRIIKYLGVQALKPLHTGYLVVRLDTNYLCDLKCQMYYFSGDKIKRLKPISIDLFKKIAEDISSKVQILLN